MVEGRYTLFRACSIPILTRSRKKTKGFFYLFQKIMRFVPQQLLQATTETTDYSRNYLIASRFVTLKILILKNLAIKKQSQCVMIGSLL